MTRTTLRRCVCAGGGNPQMVQLDSNHWLVECQACGAESAMHWSKMQARAMWNRAASYEAAKREAEGAV